MNITIHYEAQLRNVAGVGRETLILPDGGTLLELLRRAAEVHGSALQERLLDATGAPLPSVLLFVNDLPVTPDAAASRVLRTGDTVLLYPPISGG